MTAERWARIEKAFEAVADLSPAEATARLDEVCGGDAELRREVESLLAFDGLGEGAARQAVLEQVGSLAGEQDDSWVGRRLGNYRITRVIGAGGMGTVFEATRDDQEFAKRVAIKLIRAELADEGSRRRFLEERQILASLEHPHIARLLDGGTHGRTPYLVMEYVEGVPVTAWCAAHAPRIRQRLGIFLDLCDAVQYAHQKLVVHRDLKPANTLVSEAGNLKLLDFGVAKLIDPEATRGDTAFLPFTPDYASPEQVRGERTSPASDVYALGALLYQLLTGAKPHRLSTYSTVEIARSVCDEDPALPSQAAPERRRELEGDLDAIVTRAMRKNPEARYGSAEQLAADIRRHLEGLPVQARKGTWTYRAQRFVRRNALVIGAASLLFTSLAGGLIAYRQASQRAERRFNQVRTLANVLMFDVHDKLLHVEGATEARKLLAETSEKYLNSLSADVGNDPNLRLEVAMAYLRLALVEASSFNSSFGQTGKAMADYRKTIELAEPLIQNPETARKAGRLVGQTYLRLGVEERDHNDLDAAMSHMDRAIRILNETRARFPGDNAFALQSILGAQNTQGDIWRDRGDLLKAQAYFEQALATARECARIAGTPVNRMNIGFPLARLAETLRDQGLLDQARHNQEQAITQLAVAPTADLRARYDAVQTLNLALIGGGLWNPSFGEDVSALVNKSYRIFEGLARRDPDDARARRELAEAAVARAEMAERDVHAARALAEQAARSMSAESYPASVALGADAESLGGWLAVREGDAAGLDHINAALGKLKGLKPASSELRRARLRLGDALMLLHRPGQARAAWSEAAAEAQSEFVRLPSALTLLWVDLCESRLAATEDRASARARMGGLAARWDRLNVPAGGRDYAKRRSAAAMARFN